MFVFGQVLRVRYPGFFHYGIYIGNNEVIHNSKKGGCVEQVSLDTFSDGRQVLISSISASNRKEAVEKAKSYLNYPYDLFYSNCEHFVRLICGLDKESRQLQKASLAITGLACLSSSSVPLKTIGTVCCGTAICSSDENADLVKNAFLIGCIFGLAYCFS